MDVFIFFILLVFSQSITYYIPFESEIKQNSNRSIYLENRNPKSILRSISNYHNHQFLINLLFGSHKQLMKLILDTRSDFIWVPSSFNNQSINKYHSDDSSTFHLTNDSITVQYAVGKIVGNFVRDSVFIDNNIELKELSFLIANDTFGFDLNVIDGVMGLGINIEKDENKSFIQQLYKQGIITAPSFAIYLSENSSFILFGDISSSPELKIIMTKMGQCNVPKGTIKWQCPLKSITINKSKIRSQNSAIVFDTGCKYIIIPVIHLRLFKQEYIDKVNTICGVTEINQIICKCPSKEIFSGNLTLNINGYHLIIPRDQLISYDPKFEYQCRFNVLIDLNLDSDWILGTEGMKGVLFNFDLSQRKIQFIKTILPDKITTNDRVFNDVWKWILIGFGIIILGILLYTCCKSIISNSTHKQD